MARNILDDSSPSNMVTYREERFIDRHPGNTSLIKIGEYVRTPLYEPSIRSMRLSLSDVRKQLEKDRQQNASFNLAWQAATKMFQMRSSFLKKRFKGPEEYCIAVICYTLDTPYNIYDEFNRMCQELMTDTWADFPYKSLLYLLIQAEMRMITSEDVIRSADPKLKHPITIISDLDYSIEEGEEGQDIPEPAPDPNSTSPVLHTSFPKIRRQMFRVYRGLDFPLGDKEFQPRTVVAFSHIMPTTLDGTRIVKSLQAKGNGGKKTLLEIDEVSWSTRYVASLSVFPIEKEVIIWPWIKFYVEERRMIGKNVEKILLKPTSRSFLNE